MKQRFLVPLVFVVLELTHAELININYENKISHGVVSVGVGSPATSYNLLLDTASSNTWVGANPKKPFVKTKTSEDTGHTVQVDYGSSSKFSGKEYLDTVTMSGLGVDKQGLGVDKQGIGAATSATGMDDLDGILGLGPVDLTTGTLNDPILTVPTITDNLFSKGTIPKNEVGIGRNVLTFGGTDSSEFTGSVTYVTITATSPANTYWGIDASFNYGVTPILSTTAGTVDHGTSLLLLATDAFQKFQTATGGVLHAGTGLLEITRAQYENLKSLFFVAGGTTFEITPNALIWPRQSNSEIGGSSGGIYLIVGDLKSHSGQGLDFVVGYRILYDRLYTVLDTANQRVGLATTPYTFDTGN